MGYYDIFNKLKIILLLENQGVNLLVLGFEGDLILLVYHCE